MTTSPTAPAEPTEPAWLSVDPYPDGPHWPGCERNHPGCAWHAGVAHGKALADLFPDDTPTTETR